MPLPETIATPSNELTPPAKHRRLRPWLVGVLSVAYLLVAGELAYRFMDGYQFTSLALQPRAVTFVKSSEPTAFERKMLDAVTLDRSLDRTWFFAPISWPARPTPSEIAERTKSRNFGGAENYVWNENYLRLGDPSLTELFNAMKPAEIFAFRGYDDGIYPRYRLLPMVNAGGGPTNQYGFLYGPDLALTKGAKTIRVAWLGDSTSSQVNNFLDAFFRAWSRARGDGIEVEVINAARNASDLHDMAAVLKHELAPFGIDYVISYSGNRMALDHLQANGIIKAPPEVRAHAGAFEYEETDWLRRFLKPHRDTTLVKNSALVRHGLLHLINELPGSELVEPPKPAVELVYTPAYNDRAPVLAETRKIYHLGRKLAALDAFKAAAMELDATPLVSTELVYVQPGMVVRHRPNRHLYGVANGSTYAPLSYRDIRKSLAAHNAVIATWARENGVPLLDTASIMPQLPILSGDTVHDIELGIRMRAWIAFQALLPMIEKDLKSGRLPRPQRPDPGRAVDAHPLLDLPLLKVQRTALTAAYALPPSPPGTDAAGPILAGLTRRELSLASLRAIDAGTRIEAAPAPQTAKVIQLSTLAQPYAASLPVDEDKTRGGQGIISIRAKAVLGRIGVCLVARDGGQIGVCQVLAPRDGQAADGQLLQLLVPELSDLAGVKFANFEPGQRSPASLVLGSLELWQRDGAPR